MGEPGKGFWGALASIALSLEMSGRLLVAFSVTLIGFFFVAGVVYTLTEGSTPARVALWAILVGTLVVIFVGIYMLIRSLKP